MSYKKRLTIFFIILGVIFIAMLIFYSSRVKIFMKELNNAQGVPSEIKEPIEQFKDKTQDR